MEPISTPAAGPRAAAAVLAELVIQNGRLKGTRRPLTPPLTLIGRSAGCDVRLNVEGVQPLHCLLAHGADGLLLRLVPGVTGTQLNGAPAADGPLADGDVVSVGPFQFQVRVSGSFATQVAAEAQAQREQERDALDQERDALRIQAAAVVAQQAALGEEEARLQQRRATLEQQEEQLSTHLEEKRRRLSELREQIKDAHALLRREREVQATRLTETRQELEVLRREVEDGREQMQTDRQRLRNLRRRLKHRWHRHWALERAAMRQREAEVARRLAELERETLLLEEERARLAQDRLAFNGDVELGRRRQQAAWDELRQEKQHEVVRLATERTELSEQSEAIEERELALADTERELAAEQQHWQQARRVLEKEIEGLENRARNFRRKIHDEEQAVRHLEAVRADLREGEKGRRGEGEKGNVEATPSIGSQASERSFVSLSPLLPFSPSPLLPAVSEAGLGELERLTSEVADQRWCLVEQYERLVQAQQHWQHQHETAAAELEVVARRLEQRELGIERQERGLDSLEQRLREQQRAALHLQRYLEGWQARMTARESAWRGERDRLLADAQGREELAEQRLKAVGTVQQRWTRRRRLEVDWLRSERTICEKLRREWAGMRDDWLRRSAELEKEQRELEERALALEQHQQECLGQSPNASAVSRRLEKLRRRWEGLSAKTAKDLAHQRATLADEVAELKDERKRLQKQSAHLSTLEEELSQRQTQGEQKELLIEDELSRLRNDVVGTHAQRDRYEKQVNELRDEVERLARLLLDEAEPVHLPAAQAA